MVKFGRARYEGYTWQSFVPGSLLRTASSKLRHVDFTHMGIMQPTELSCCIRYVPFLIFELGSPISMIATPQPPIPFYYPGLEGRGLSCQAICLRGFELCLWPCCVQW